MADLTFATYQFLPWARRGMAAHISQDDTLGANGGAVLERATVPVTVELNNATISTTNEFTLLGPGDIVGIKSDEIIRTEPLDGISNFEPNYLAYIEFYDEDFPWRYTPARAVGPNSERLRPWLALIVLRETEFEETKRREPLAAIKVTNASALQPPNELHLWAHTHSNLPDPTSDQEAFIESLEKAYKTDPDGLYSRVLCPRRLAPNALYHAFLVPSYETGRLAGLGRDTSKVPAQQPSWGAQGNDNELPYYHRWMFRTGENFDFESLVKLLEPRVMDKRVGVRPMNCSRPGFVTATANPGNPGNEVSSVNPAVMMLEGALLAPSTERDPEPFDTTQTFVSQLKALIDLNTGYEEKLDSDPVVTVPFYGMYHALQPEFLPTDNLLWYNELNRDPRTRVAAGFGTRMVQENQEKFMDSAWKQLKNVLEANKKMHAAQVTAKVAEQMHAKHIAPLFEEKILSMARTLTSRVPVPLPPVINLTARSAKSEADGPEPRPTVKNAISQSAIPDAMFMHPFRRAMRNNSSVLRGIQRKSSEDIPDINKTGKQQRTASARGRSFNASLLSGTIEGANAGFLSAAPKLFFLGVEGVNRQLSIPENFDKVRTWSLKSNLDDDFIYNLPGFTGGLPNVVNWDLIFGPGIFDPGVLGGPKVGGGIFLGGETGFFHPRFLVLHERPIAARTAAAKTETEDFKKAFTDLNTRLGFAENIPAPTQPDLAGISAATKQYVKPSESYVRLIKSAIALPGTLKAAPNKTGEDDFLPVMAYPDYPDPTYEFLRDIDKELLLPNLDLIPPNTLSLLRTNQRFIESYLVGVNYEMGRELLWREYPTDMRGSYFRQFWDVRGIVSPTTTPPDSEEAKDIKPIHTWLEKPPLKPDRRALGLHNARDLEGDAEQLVFVVRGELLKKFPNTVIYAQKAETLASGKRGIAMGLSGDEFKKKILFPQYKAEIQPDIKLFGFDLTIKEAAGIDKGKGFNDNLGWYFIIAEVPGEPRFGMDLTFNRNKPDLLTWNDLSWENFAGQELAFVGSMPPSNFNVSDDPDTPGDESPGHSGIWARSSADMASILFQRPVMIATHAREMLDRKFENPDTSAPIESTITLYDHVKPLLK